MLSNNAVGTAGELRVMSELLFKGYNPAKSYLDNGVDIILENGTKIQVKTSTFQHHYFKKRSSHVFSLAKGNKKEKIPLSKYVDFLICFIPSKDEFYIMPTYQLKIAYTLRISTNKNKSKYTKYLNNWEILKNGK